MLKYSIHPDFIGKQHCDLSGVYCLNDKLSQKVLKELYRKGNKFILANEYESKKKSDKSE